MNFAGYVQRRSKLLIFLSAFWCLCRFCFDVLLLCTGTFAIFSTKVDLPYATEIIVYQLSAFVNSCYCILLSFHSGGIFKLLKEMENIKTPHATGNFWKTKVSTVALVVLCFIPSCVVLAHTAYITDANQYLERDWHFLDSSVFNKLKYFMISTVFIIVPQAVFTFQFFFIILVLYMLEKFERMNKFLAEGIDIEHTFDNLRTFYTYFKQLSQTLGHLNTKFTLLLGFNVPIWTVLICLEIYVVRVRSSVGFLNYLFMYQLVLMGTLLCCSLLKQEVFIYSALVTNETRITKWKIHM